MSRLYREGTCHICGSYGKLSFEHVPPRGAFNDRPILYNTLEKIVESADLDKIKGRKQQLGAGGYTLCDGSEGCNVKTGNWYSHAFVDFAYQGMSILKGTQGRATLIYPFNIFPLRLIKQIITMFFSVNSDRFRLAQPALVRFILNKDEKYLPPNIKVFAFYTVSHRNRMIGAAGVIKGLGTSHSHTIVISEITFPPFGFAMTLDSYCPDNRLLDITGFSTFDYNDKRTLRMRLPVLPIYTGFPGDYRAREQVLEDAGMTIDDD